MKMTRFDAAGSNIIIICYQNGKFRETTVKMLSTDIETNTLLFTNQNDKTSIEIIGVGNREKFDELCSCERRGNVKDLGPYFVVLPK